MSWIQNILKTLVLVSLLPLQPIFAQDNVGIGTKNPHPSAILDVSDSSRGVLIPKTDTLAIANYMATLVPNPGIADGLLIMDTNLNTYLYYDAVEDDWKELIGLVGPTGPKGFPGPMGPTGDTGLTTKWTDSNVVDPNILYDPLIDTCGDWYINNETGQVWWLWCDSNNGSRGPWYIDTVRYDNFIGQIKAPNERIIVQNTSCLLRADDNMANAGVKLEGITGLGANISVNRDEIAYIWVTAYGTASKFFGGNEKSYLQYDITVGGNNFYYDRFPDSIAHIFTMGGNGPPPTGQPFGLDDFMGWHVSAFYILRGPISPSDCGPCGLPPACTSCPPLTANVNIQVVGGNRFNGSSGTGDVVILADEANKDQAAHMNVYAIIRTNPNTWIRKR